MKLRVPQGKWRVKMFQAYGANPSPMALSEVFVALQTGVMDGQENPLTQIYSSKFQEVQKYLSMTGHVYTPAYLATGKTSSPRCRADVQAILAQAAKDTQAYVYEQAAKLDDDLLARSRRPASRSTRPTRTPSSPPARASTRSSARKCPDGGKLVDKAIALGKGM